LPIVDLSEDSEDIEEIPVEKNNISNQNLNYKYIEKRKKLFDPLEYICSDETVHTGNYKPNILVDYPTLSKEIQQANLHQLNLKRGLKCTKQIEEKKSKDLETNFQTSDSIKNAFSFNITTGKKKSSSFVDELVKYRNNLDS
jgi:hypothetical protein